MHANEGVYGDEGREDRRKWERCEVGAYLFP